MSHMLWWQSIELGYEGFGAEDTGGGTPPIDTASVSAKLRTNFERGFAASSLIEWCSDEAKVAPLESYSVEEIAEFLQCKLNSARNTDHCPKLFVSPCYQVFDCYLDYGSEEGGDPEPKLAQRVRDPKPPGIKCKMVGHEWRDYISFYVMYDNGGTMVFWDGSMNDERGKGESPDPSTEDLGNPMARPEVAGLENVYITVSLIHPCMAHG